jgi:hypothetical protein
MSVRYQRYPSPADSGFAPGGFDLPANDSETWAYFKFALTEEVRRLFDTDLPEWDTGSFSDPLPRVQKELTLGRALSVGYDNPSTLNREYRLNVAIDRDSRFNAEEREQYLYTEAELEFGSGFFERAHP